ncbi:hypothetical protein E0H75_35435 [Kribbella capetownensis]|uniref:Uncharacterized protein n=1 Tax=Kribbella capetownensis TaxID=1572659 RepID=A0A4R0JBY2_9ACTN|nr:hypothetical protein [Kribbella capetownensis]TCC44161.1 hypothetical protein E0H75_35435 [Kribbella capetownensis]
MTDTQTTGGIRPNRPLSGHRSGLISRLLRSIGYDALLVPIGALTMADAVMGENEKAYGRWSKLARLRQRERRPGTAAILGHGFMSSVLGLLSWFLGMLWVMAVVRGPFYGFVEDGPFGPGTWGGPTKAGAWAVHAAVAVPIILALPFVLRGIALLHVALIRRLFGLRAAWWVLPATITVCAGGLLFLWAWIEQL